MFIIRKIQIVKMFTFVQLCPTLCNPVDCSMPDVSSSQFDLWVQHSLNQNLSKLFCGYQLSDSKIYIKKQKTQNSQHNNKGKA